MSRYVNKSEGNETFDVEYQITSNAAITRELNGKKVVDFYLQDSIGNMRNYTAFLDSIAYLQETDSVIVHINCYGGWVDTASQLRNALIKTEAEVVVKVEGMCASAATFFFNIADEIEIAPNSIVMIHAMSGFQYGKFHEQIAQSDFYKKWTVSFAKDIYDGILTSEEIDQMLDGKDFYFTDEEFAKRIEAMMHAREQTIKEQEDFQDRLQKEADKFIQDFMEKEESKKKKAPKKEAKNVIPSTRK